MVTINHQFQNQNFYFPEWKVKYLFIGTFNPEGGQAVKYYYGRERNQTWKLLSKIFCVEFDPKSENFFQLLYKYKIACIDMIDCIQCTSNHIENIKGKGYSDSAIINGKVSRKYNTEKILEIIENNKGINVFSTWGKGPKLKEWRIEIEKLGEINSLVSPSMAARVPKGTKKFNYMLSDWKNSLNT